MTSYRNGDYTVKARRTLVGWLATYEFLPVGDRIAVRPDYPWWRPTRRWAVAAVNRRIRRERRYAGW